MNKKWQIYEANVEETNRIAEKYNINKLLASIIINRKIDLCIFRTNTLRNRKTMLELSIHFIIFLFLCKLITFI